MILPWKLMAISLIRKILPWLFQSTQVKKKPWGPFDFDKSIREKITTLHPKLILLLSQNGKTYQFLKLQVGSAKSPDRAQVILQYKAYTPLITYQFPKLQVGSGNQARVTWHPSYKSSAKLLSKGSPT